VGIPPAPKGLAQIELSLVATKRDLILQAIDLTVKKHLKIIKMPVTVLRAEIAPAEGEDSSLLTILKTLRTNSGVVLQLYEKLYRATLLVLVQQGNLLIFEQTKGDPVLLVFTSAAFVLEKRPEDAVIVEMDGPALWSKLLDVTKSEGCEVEVDPLQPHSIRLNRKMILGMVLKFGTAPCSD